MSYQDKSILLHMEFRPKIKKDVLLHEYSENSQQTAPSTVAVVEKEKHRVKLEENNENTLPRT